MKTSPAYITTLDLAAALMAITLVVLMLLAFS